MFHIVKEINGLVPALVFSDHSLSLVVFDFQAFCLALGIGQSLAHNPTQRLGLLPIPKKKKKCWLLILITVIIVIFVILQ